MSNTHRTLAHCLAHLRRHHRRRCFFQYFLVTTLYGTFALKQIKRITVLVGENLYFYMTGGGDIFFYKNCAIAKSGLCLVDGKFHLLLQFAALPHNAHTFAAAAGCCFYQQGKTDLLCQAQGFGNIADSTFSAGYQGHLVLCRRRLCSEFITHHIYGFGRRTYKYKSGGLYIAGELGIFAQKTKPRMYAFGSAFQCNFNNTLTS